MTDPAIIEAAAKVIYANGSDKKRSERHYATARAVLREVTPLIEAAAALEKAAFFDSDKYAYAVTSLIRNAALEEAAKVAEDYTEDPEEGIEIAAVIRALKEQP
jgi:hypothetical protein